MEPVNTKLIEHIRSRCTVDSTSDCWNYALSANGSGYANTIRHAFGMGGDSEMIQGSRLAYVALRGPIPADHECDHLCKNKLCLNPWHLEAVTPSINKERNRIAEPHPLTAWMFPSPAIIEVNFSSTMLST